MATVYVTEFQDLGTDLQGNVPQVVEASTALTQTVDTGDTSSEFSDTTYIIRVVASDECFIAVGYDPDTNDESMPLVAGTVEYFTVRPGQRLAVAP